MNLLSLLAIVVCMALPCLMVYYFRGRNRIASHPNVEPIDIAHPGIAEEVRAMVGQIACIAKTPIPEVFIFRAERPNAFIIPSGGRPMLFLADELFEECDELGPEKGLAKLEWTICHEIAHIRERHAFTSGFAEGAALIGLHLNVKRLVRFAEKKRGIIERQANERAKILFKKIEASFSIDT